jgi:CRISPR-associated protein Csd1
VKDGEDIPQEGFSNAKISFCVLFDQEGNFVNLTDVRNQSGRTPQSVFMTVPAAENRPGKQIKSFLLWDNADYALGIDTKGRPEQAAEKFEAFADKNNAFCTGIDNIAVQAFCKFLHGWNPSLLADSPYLEDLNKGANIVFRMDGEMQYIHEYDEVKAKIVNSDEDSKDDKTGFCLVTGQNDVPIARLHMMFQGVQGAQSAGASLVSFNQDSFTSYGKDQSFNSPVSKQAVFAYGTVLNHLLASNSRQKYGFGGTTFVFWTERKTEVENFFSQLFGGFSDAASKEMTDGDNSKIRLFLDTARLGIQMPEELGDESLKFYILGLSPNAARLSVRFWMVNTLGEIHKKIGQHISDCLIEAPEGWNPYPSIWHILRETAFEKKSENILSTLEGTYSYAVMSGGLYPETILSRLIGRIRADGDINFTRMYAIKGYLNRKSRILNKKTEVSVSLDKENNNPAYLLGRLFAVLEKAQADAIGNANSTIKDRYFGSASSTPASVFPLLLRLSQHHISKAEYGRISDMRIQEIMDNLKQFPKILNLEQQGIFAIGYYQQKNDFYRKQDKKENEND